MWWHFTETEEGVRQQPIWELIPKVVKLFRKQLKYLYLALILLIPITVANLAGPLVLRHIIDVNIVNMDATGIFRTALLYVVIIATSAILGYFQAVTIFRMGINILTDLKSRLFEHLLNLGLDFHADHPPGKLLSRVEGDVETLKELFGDVVVNLTRSLLMTVGTMVMFLMLDFQIGAWVLALMPFLFAAAFWYLIKMRPWWREQRARWAIVLGYTTEYVQGIEVLQQYNYSETAKKRMREVNIGKYKIEMPAMFFEYSFWGAFLFGEIIGVIIVLVLGIQKAISGELSIGTFAAFFEYIRRIFFPIIFLSAQLNFIQRGLISVERVFGILERERSIKDGPRSSDELTFDREIAFENVWFAYEKENWILKDVSFKITKGQTIALVGASGGGKTTIINLLLRFYEPQKGRITVDGKDIKEFNLQDYRSLLGLVLQDIYLFPGSVKDNLRVFDSTISIEDLERASKIARADGIINKLPDSYDGELAERGANLSVGERQLISFARALSHDPPLLVLDEATSSVDPHTERLVQEALTRLLEGRTAVIVAHRLSTILNSDNILVIHNGELIESGTHRELIDLDGVYAKLSRLQFEEFGTGAEPRGRAS
jgi:ATP-binding cassette subfamily B protein